MGKNVGISDKTDRDRRAAYENCFSRKEVVKPLRPALDGQPNASFDLKLSSREYRFPGWPDLNEVL